MPQSDGPATTRRPTNVTLLDALVREARALKVNVSRACEQGLAAEVAKTRAQRWLEENAAALDTWNVYIEEHGLPLDRYRQF